MEDWNKKLITAASTGNIEALKLSLQNGSDIDYQDTAGRTALMAAARRGHLEITRLLLDSRCNTDITNVIGVTALMLAAQYGHLEIIRLLLNSRCNTDITNRDEYTALHIAAGFGRLQITRCLVEQGGASPLVNTLKGETPYDLAATWKRRQYEKVMEYLQSVMSVESSDVTAVQGMGGKHLYPDVHRPLKYPGHDSESDLKPIRYPETQTDDAPSNQIHYPYSGAATSDYPSDRSNHNTASINTFSGSDGDFIQVVKDLLTERKVDVIVNSVSHNLDLSRGRLSKSILVAAGDIIQTEVYQYIGTFQPFLNVVVTSGGNMPCKNIIHGMLAPFDGLETKSVKILQMFIAMCLKKASDLNMTSIAFPAIGTGILNFPVDIVAKTMFEIVLLYKQKAPDSSIKNVEFVINPIDTDTVRAFEDEQRKAWRKTSSQTYTGDMVPNEIKLMADKRSIDLYLKLLESGYEKKRDIRLVVVGKKGAGKTSLIRRLLGEDITDVTSTNGIEIHTVKCKAMSDDCIWNKLDENYEETQARLFKEYVGKLHDNSPIKEPVESHIAIKDNTPVTFFDESKKSEIASKIIKPSEAAEPQSEVPVTPQQSNQSFEQAARDYETMLTAKSQVDVHDKEEYATLLLWDFAGDEEFYHTHQTFLSQDAMYLVVTKLNEADDPNAQALFRLWIDSIHCYSRLEEESILSDDKTMTSGELDPPVVIVGTWKDAVTSETNTVEEACREILNLYTENLADDERGHIRFEYFISNKEDERNVFQQIRQNILNLARGMRTWNKQYPLKFIQLEQRLQEKKKELPIISYQEMKNISSDTPKPLTEDELLLFLEFHHELRSVVFFKDLSKHIILDTQWLSDAFKCVVTAKKFRINIRHQKEWNDFFKRGKLNNAVLEDIFKNETTILYEHKDFILNVMEKFDIIIHPNKSEGADEKPCYYVPCMIKEDCQCDIYQMFKVQRDTRHRSTWLCFKFRFLPPHLKNHLIASLSRKYTIAQVGISNQKNMQIAIFRDIVIFELQKTKLRKLLVTTCSNAIQIQVLEFGKGIERGFFKDIADFVEMELEKIIHTRFNMSNVKFEKKWECGLTKPEFVTGINDFGGEQMTEYYCETCRKTHTFVDEWSGLQTESLCLLPGSDDDQHQNPHPETSSKNPTFSTKVRCFVQGSMRSISNVAEESTKTGCLTGLTKEEMNYAKMGMIVLNILADVLYDLLMPDKPHLPLRSDCDITYLYKELRRLNKNIPSNQWGGTWQTILVTDIAIGDDIERIRLTRNDLQHSRKFTLDDTRFNDLYVIIVDLVKRFDLHNKPARLYTDQLKEIIAKTVSEEKAKCIQHQLINELKLEMAIDIEIEQR